MLNELGIAYLIGGSVASSAAGFPRSTQDVDFVADISETTGRELVDRLAGAFHVDADAVLDAIRRRDSFSVVHLATMVKADIFIKPAEAWAEEEWSRRRLTRIGPAGAEVEVEIASPEDMILQKLRRYDQGRRVSDRQWGDVTGILKIQGSALDFGYLFKWARDLALRDLLDQALADAGATPDGDRSGSGHPE